MSNELDSHAEHPESSSENKPEVLSKDQLLSRAKTDFAQLLESGEMKSEDLEAFVAEKVTGIKVNGVDVISIDMQHEKDGVDPITRAYLGTPRTAVNVAEYFYHEL